MAKLNVNGEYCCTCIECKKSYDLSSLSLVARQKRQRNLYCPHCGKKVGTVN